GARPVRRLDPGRLRGPRRRGRPRGVARRRRDRARGRLGACADRARPAPRRRRARPRVRRARARLGPQRRAAARSLRRARRMSRLLFLYPREGVHGGGEVLAAWMIQALRDEHDLSVLAWRPLDVAGLNATSETSLRADDWRLVRPPAAVRATGDLVRGVGL